MGRKCNGGKAPARDEKYIKDIPLQLSQTVFIQTAHIAISCVYSDLCP